MSQFFGGAPRNSDPTYFGPKSWYATAQAQRLQKSVGVQNLFGCFPSPQLPPILVLKFVFGKLALSPRCVPNLKSLDWTVVEISRGPNIFCGVWSLALIPGKFDPKSFLAAYSPNPSCVQNLMQQASRVAKINRVFQICLYAPLAQPLPFWS